MREAATITLDGRSFAIRPLTLGQVERIEAALATGSGAIGQGIAVVTIGLARDHAAAGDLRELEVGAAELGVAMSVVLRQGGFLPAGEPPAAARNDASTSAPSADG